MIVACVRTGTKYGPEYVERLVRGIRRHSSVDGCKFVCLTDQPETWPGVENHRVELSGWWAKLYLFNPDWRGDHRLVYLDLDTVVLGNVDPLLRLETEFAICHSFTPAHLKHPCKYSSCAIALAPHYGRHVYDEFMANKSALIPLYARYGDQLVMERVDGSARSLQEMLPPGFFSYYRDGFRKDASLLIFGAKAKPHNSRDHWVTEAWVA